MNISGSENGQCKGPELAMVLTMRQKQSKYGWQVVNEWNWTGAAVRIVGTNPDHIAPQRLY